MPGAPNRPPTTSLPVPPPSDDAARLVLRRLAPSRVALNLDIWKGAVAPDLANPYEKAEALYRSGDLIGARAALDQLSVRLAEPRWPSIPEPFRQLRVRIPQPQPPQWDPEYKLEAAERQSRQQRRDAETQLSLLTGAMAWAQGHQIDVADLQALRTTAEAQLAVSADEFWRAIDQAWLELLQRIPPPRKSGAAPVPPADAS